MKNFLPAIRFLFLIGFGLLFASATPASDNLSAQIRLESSAATATLTGDTAWTLDKTGSLAGDSVTWEITATQVATVSGQLVLSGQMTVTNAGSGAATIGNIIANLQTRVGNKWAPRSSDIADATDGDDADTAYLHAAASSEHQAMFVENAASGRLEFMDATNNTMFSLVPQVLIGPGETVPLLFSASFDNNLLGLVLADPRRQLHHRQFLNHHSVFEKRRQNEGGYASSSARCLVIASIGVKEKQK
jgi:hypothetical protein